MKNLTIGVLAFLDDQEIAFESTEHAGLLKLEFAGDHGVFMGYIEVDEEKRLILIETFVPVGVPQDKRLRIAEFIVRFNRDGVIGTLDLDMDKGIMSFRTSIALGRSELHPDILEHLLGVNWCIVDRLFPAIVGVLHGYYSPQEAIENVQKGAFEPDEWGQDDFDEALNEKLDVIQYRSLNRNNRSLKAIGNETAPVKP